MTRRLKLLKIKFELSKKCLLCRPNQILEKLIINAKSK